MVGTLHALAALADELQDPSCDAADVLEKIKAGAWRQLFKGADPPTRRLLRQCSTKILNAADHLLAPTTTGLVRAELRHAGCTLLTLSLAAGDDAAVRDLLRAWMALARSWLACDQLERASVALGEAATLASAAGIELELSGLHILQLEVACKLEQWEAAEQVMQQAKALCKGASTAHLSFVLSAQFCDTLLQQVVGMVQGAAPMQMQQQAAEQGATQAAIDLLNHGWELMNMADDACRRDGDDAQQSAEPGGGAGTLAQRLGGSSSRQVVEELRDRILIWLGLCSLRAYEPSTALNCLKALRDDESPLVGTALMAALEACARAAAADASAPAAVSELLCHPDADKQMCLHALEQLLCGGPVESLPSMSRQLQARFPDDPTITLACAKMVDQAAATWSSEEWVDAALLAIIGQGQAAAAQDDAGIALQPGHGGGERQKAQGDEQQQQEDVASRNKLQHECFVLLFNRGVQRFESRKFEAAIALLEAAAVHAGAVDSSRCKVGSALALCRLALGQAAAALQQIDAAVQACSPGPIPAALALLRFKVHLDSGESSGALHALPHLVSAPDFSPDMLSLACQEAVSVQAYSVALQVLQEMLKLAMAEKAAPGAGTGSSSGGGDGSPPCCLPEATIIRLIIKLIMDEAAAAAASATASKPAVEAGAAAADETMMSSYHGELARCFNLAAERLKVLGCTAFMESSKSDAPQQQLAAGGGDSASGPSSTHVAELAWFAHSAWNCGLAAAEKQDYQACSVLMAAAAAFFGASSANAEQPAEPAKALQYKKVALMLAGAAALEVHSNFPEHAASLGLCLRMMAAARTAGKELEAARLTAGLPAVGAEDRSDVFLAIQEFTAAARQGDQQAQLRVLQASGRLLSCTQLLQLAALCEGSNKLQQGEPAEAANSGEVSAQAYTLALHKLLEAQAGAGGDDCGNHLGFLLRRLFQLCKSDSQRLQLMREARQILMGMQPGRVPAVDMKWLVAQSWNRGVGRCMQYGPSEEAAQHMTLALELLKFCPPAYAALHKEAMERQMGKVMATAAAVATTSDNNMTC